MTDTDKTVAAKSARLSTATHEAGHALVLQRLGVPIERIKIGIGGNDWCGKTNLAPNDIGLQLIDELTICVAGLKAQELVGCELPPCVGGGANSDYRKVQELFDRHDIAESERDDLHALALARAHEILCSQLDRLKEIAQILVDEGCLDQQRIAALFAGG